MQIEHATPANFAELMDFFLKCFRTVNPKHPSFEELYPEIYYPASEHLPGIIFVRDSGRVASSSGVFDIPLHSGTKSMKISGLGNVSTDPEMRGKGLMRLVLKECMAMIRKADAPFSWLGGFRYRYGVYGWEHAGYFLNYTMIPKNRNKVPGSGLEVQEVSAQQIDLQEFINLRNVMSFRGDACGRELERKFRRPNSKIFYAYKNQKAAAFAVISSNTILEYGGAPEGVADIIHHTFSASEKTIVRTSPVNDAYTRIFSRFAEDMEVVSYGSFMVVNLRKCAELVNENPALNDSGLKGRYGVNMLLDSEWFPGQEIYFGYENGVPVVGKPKKAKLQLKLEPMKAASLFFGPMKPSIILGSENLVWLDSLLPLVIGFPGNYNV